MSSPAAAPAPAPTGKSSTLVVALLAGLNVAVLAGAGVFFFFFSSRASGDASHDAAGASSEGEEHEEEEGEHELGPLVEFESIVVNTADEGEHFLKVTFQLELGSEEDVEHVESRMAPFRDRVLTHLTSLHVADCEGPDHVASMRESLIEIARGSFGHDRVQGLYFTELLVQ